MRLDASFRDFLSQVQIIDGALCMDAVAKITLSVDQILKPVKPLVARNTLNAHASLEQNIWAILNNPSIRKGDPALLKPEIVHRYLSQIRRAVQRGEPIPMIFIAFPFKAHHNPLKTDRVLPDFGELTFVRRLMEIHASVQCIYPPGLHWTILSESDAYRSLLGIPAAEATAYRQGIERYLELLNAQSTIRMDCLTRVAMSYEEFPDAVRNAYQRFHQQYSQGGAVAVSSFEQIFWTMRNSMDFTQCTAEELYYLGRDEVPSVNGVIADKWRAAAASAVEATLQYLAYNEAKNTVGQAGLGIVQETFPHACYVAITPKPNRYAFHPVSVQSKFFPHHGVPLVMGKKQSTTRIVYLIDILLQAHRYTSVYIDGDTEAKPFFYQQQERKNGNGHLSGAWEI